MKKLVAAISILALMLGVFLIGGSLRANATEDECVPSDAWTETIEHPAVTHEETIVVVDQEAWTETITVVDEEAWTETIPATPDLWWNWSPNKQQEPFDGPPAFPNDERGTWQGPHENGGPMQDTYGTFETGNGHGDWFHRERGNAEQVIEHPAVTHEETIEHPAVTHEETITVVDEEAWTEVIEHPAVTCDGEQPDPLVSTSTTSEYNCGDAFETITTVVTTTEYISDGDGGWVLGDPVSETATEQVPHKVEKCDGPGPDDDDPAPSTKTEHLYTCSTHTAVTYEKHDGEWIEVSRVSSPTGADCKDGEKFTPEEEGM